MKKILTLKSWQLFVLLVIPPLFNSTIASVIWYVIFIGWLYILGESLYNKLPSNSNRPNLKFFRLNCVFAFSYLLIISTVFIDGYNITTENISDFGTSAYLILPLHFYTMFALLYAIYFIARSIKSIEKQRTEVPTDEYIGYFFMLWFFPIGIWWLQPKIKTIFSENKTYT